MLEKLIENWLISTNERGYMPAFCQLLVSQGYQLLYISPHGPDEAGKDIVARNPNSKLECFQLKNGDVSLPEFRKIEGELEELLKHPIIHPSVSTKERYSSLLVVNGRVNDPVRTRIKQRNDANWNESRSTKLDYFQREQLIQKFVEYYGSFFPQEAKNFRDFLGFYIAPGDDFIDKAQLCAFLEKHFESDSKKLSNTQIAHLISSSLILVNYAISPWIKSKNYVSQIESWVCLLAYIYSRVEKHNLPDKYWSQSESIVITFIESNFKDLLSEVEKRHHLIEGDWPSDGIVYPARTTIVLGYLCSYALYRRLQNNPLEESVETKILEINKKYENKLKFWGEVFSPHLFAYFWFNSIHGRQMEAVGRFSSMLHGLVNPKKSPQPYGFPNPYFSYENSVRIVNQLMIDDPKQHFVGQSYSMWSMVETLARRGYRDILADLWPKISKTQYSELVSTNKHNYLTWKVEKGKLIEKFPNQTQSWKTLVEDSASKDYTNIPAVLLNKPAFALVFMLVFPQRLTPGIIKGSRLGNSNKTILFQ